MGRACTPGCGPGERMFTFTSTGWALWNMQVNALMHGASIVLYEGSPGFPAGAVWEVAARDRRATSCCWAPR